VVGKHMQQLDTNQIKVVLQRYLTSYERLPRMLDEIAVENRPDLVDAAQSAADRELAIRQLEHDCNVARNVRAALERIEDGSFGLCVRCDSEISVKRLDAVPWAAYCITCQEFLDANQDEIEKAEGTFRWGSKSVL
jgi:DnaK suppressor protein